MWKKRTEKLFIPAKQVKSTRSWGDCRCTTRFKTNSKFSCWRQRSKILSQEENCNSLELYISVGWLCYAYRAVFFIKRNGWSKKDYFRLQSKRDKNLFLLIDTTYDSAIFYSILIVYKSFCLKVKPLDIYALWKKGT